MKEERMTEASCPIGYVLGNKAASTLEFYVIVEGGQYLELDDVVYVDSQIEGYPGVTSVRFYGTVCEVSQYHEGIQFDSDIQIVRQGILPASTAYVGKVQVTQITPEIFVSPRPTDLVYRAKGAELEDALSFARMAQRIPAGVMRNQQPFFVNFEFLNGSKGAHASISGVSGVATKTTYALFLLYSLLHYDGTGAVPPADRANAHLIAFNVKGEDMLFLDKPNRLLTERDHAIYQTMGLPMQPFDDLSFWAAPAEGLGPLTPATQQRKEGVAPFCWTMREFAQEQLLPFLFADPDQETANMAGCISSITARLEKKAEQDRGTWAGIRVGDRSLTDLYTLIESLREDLDVADNERTWFDRIEHSATIHAFLRKMRLAAEALKNLVRSDVELPNPYKIDFDAHRLTMIHLSGLKPVAQKFIVGSTLKRLMRQKEAQGARPYYFLLLDELNKYAPREGKSPIQDVLLDIAERGRSLGVILIGCQQSASEVEKRILTNASIKVNGRLDVAESQSKEYDYLSGAFRVRSTIIKPGTMVLHQPDIPAPVLVNFPMPAWATRREEWADENLEEDVKKLLERF
jgi:hypothetical protein